jgi:type VI protein secretion system component VasK
MAAVLPIEDAGAVGTAAVILTATGAVGLAGAAVQAALPIADVSAGEGAFWGILIGVGGPVAVWVSTQFWRYWDERKKQKQEDRKERQEDESAIVTGQRELIARLETERKEFIRELDEMQAEVRHMTAILASAKERIVHLEEFVTASNPKYKPWVEPPAPSARYAPAPKLPPGDQP